MDVIIEAKQLMEQQQINEATILLESHLPEANAQDKFMIADLYIRWGFLQQALPILVTLHNEFPSESDITMALSGIYITLEDDEQAIMILNDITPEDSSYLEALIQLADLYQAQGLFEVAEQKLLQAKQLDPNEVIIDFALGELLFSTGDYKGAITYYEKVLSHTDMLAQVSILARLAESYAGVADYEQALMFYDQLDTDDVHTLFAYGLTAQQAGRHDKAIHQLERLLELDANFLTAYYPLVTSYDKEEQPQKAFQTAKKGLQLDEFNKELTFYAGTLAHQLLLDQECEQFVRAAITLDPDYKEAILFMVEILKMRDDHNGIIELLTMVKETGSRDALYDWELARAYEKNESYKMALNSYQVAYNNLNDDSEFVKEYAYFLTEEGRIQEALTLFKRYLTQQPEDIEVEAFYNRLSQPNG